MVDNQQKGIHREMETTSSGAFSAPALVPASGYKVTVTKVGFARYEINDVTVQVGQVVDIKPILQVSTATTQVEVTAEAPIVDTTKTDVSQVVNSTQIMVLPINGRRVQSSPPATPTVQITSAPTPAGFTAANTGTLNGYSSGGIGNRVPFQPISGLNIDTIERIDVRLSKEFPITERFRAIFTFDAFNVFNHTYFTSVSTQEYKYALAGSVPALTPINGFGAGSATQGFPDGANAPPFAVRASVELVAGDSIPIW